jgi:hypothetical protein
VLCVRGKRKGGGRGRGALGEELEPDAITPEPPRPLCAVTVWLCRAAPSRFGSAGTLRPRASPPRRRSQCPPQAVSCACSTSPLMLHRRRHKGATLEGVLNTVAGAPHRGNSTSRRVVSRRRCATQRRDGAVPGTTTTSAIASTQGKPSRELTPT